MAKPVLIFLKMDDSNHPHMYKLRFMVLMADDNIRISVSWLNDVDYLPPVK